MSSISAVIGIDCFGGLLAGYGAAPTTRLAQQAANYERLIDDRFSDYLRGMWARHKQAERDGRDAEAMTALGWMA